MPRLRKLALSFFVAYPAAQVIAAPVRRGLARLGKSQENPFWFLHHVRAPAGTVIIDAGANAGHTVAQLRKADAVTPVVAFEPARMNFARLERHTRRLPGVTLHNVALLDREDTFHLYTPGYKNRYYGGLASLDRAVATEWLPDFAGVFLDPARVEVREETVRVQPLDAFSLAPRFIKIDVQGVVPGVLRGARRTLEAHRPVMLIERGRGDGVAELLAPLGYGEYALHGRAVRPYRGEKDALFVPREGPVRLELPDIPG